MIHELNLFESLNFIYKIALKLLFAQIPPTFAAAIITKSGFIFF